MTMRRPAAAAPLLLLLISFALVGVVVGLVQAASLATKATRTGRRWQQQPTLAPPPQGQQGRQLGGAGAEEKARLGSRPPSCRGKCNECSPCTAVQVAAPTTTLRLSNYKPMGWKCQCRDRLYQP